MIVIRMLRSNGQGGRLFAGFNPKTKMPRFKYDCEGTKPGTIKEYKTVKSALNVIKRIENCIGVGQAILS